MDSVSSTTFIKRPPCISDIQEKFFFTNELLSGRIFLGRYEERRYVTVLNEYRDVVIISSEETDLHHDIDKIKKKWSGFKGIKWLGITEPDSVAMPKVYCFWVKLSDLAFGYYWFQIKHVKLLEDEIILRLKCIRKSHPPLIAITSQVNKKQVSENISEHKEAATSSKGIIWDFNTKKAFNAFQATCTRTITYAQPFMTWRNFFLTLKIACAFLLALVMGIISLIGHLGEFSLKLIREITLLVNAFTPIVIQLIDFLTKVIGGLYILIAGMFIRNPNHSNINPFRNSNEYSVMHLSTVKPSQTLAVDWRKRNQILRQELMPNTSKKNNF